MRVLLFTHDLATGARVAAAAAGAGVELATFGARDALLEAARRDPAAAVIVEFASVVGDVAALVFELRGCSDAASGRRIVAFAPHVHDEHLAAARAAGCDRVLSRGQFFKGLDGLFGDLAR